MTSSRAKKDTIRKIGAEAVLKLREDWQRQVRSLTGKVAHVVHDSVGSPLMDSFDVAQECGHIVFYGMSGGNPPPVNPRTLTDSSKSLTGGDL